MKEERQIIIVFNGVGSSGKSSTARELQEQASLPLLHVAMDAFLDMLPARMFGDPDGLVFRQSQDDGKMSIDIETGAVCQRLLGGMRQSILAMAQMGNSMIVDEVLAGDAVFDYQQLLAGFDVRFVGFFMPLNVLEEREAKRGDREIGLARGQFPTIRRGIGYDLELDNPSATPRENATTIRSAFGL